MAGVLMVVAPRGWHGWCSLSFAELMESLRQAEQKNWTLDQHHIANLCDSLNHFLTQTGHMPPQGGSHRPPAPARITDSCALTSGKPEPSMNQGIMQSCQRSGLWRKWRVKGRERRNQLDRQTRLSPGTGLLTKHLLIGEVRQVVQRTAEAADLIPFHTVVLEIKITF